jgi:zinc protease
VRTDRFICGIFLALALICGAAHAQHYDFKDIKLDNGLRVITLEDFSTPIVAVQVWYHVGSKNEDPTRQGFAHMFEHLMFRGTDRLGPKDHFEFIRRVGGDCNAFTSFDYTAYVNDLPSNQLDLALWLEAERMMFLHVDQDNYVTERKVVEEERRVSLNEPYGTVLEKALPTIYKELPYRWTPIGSIADLEAAGVDEVKKFWDTYYVPDNAALIIVGAIKHEDAQALAKKYFGWMPSCPQPPRVEQQEPPQDKPREAVLDEPQGPVPLAAYGFRGVPESDPDFVPLEVLMGVLGGGDSSRLYLDLVKDKKIASQIMAEAYSFELSGLFGAGAALAPGAKIDDVLAALDAHLQRVINEPVSEREMTKVKNQLRRTLVTDLMTAANKARLMGEATMIHGTPDWLNQQMAKIDAVTVEDMQRVAKKYIVPENRSTFRVLPKPGSGAADQTDGTAPTTPPNAPYMKEANCKANAKRPDDYPKEPPFQSLLEEIPPAEMVKRTLDNGLQVVVVPNHEVPFATAMLGMKYGAWAENPDMPGAASMALAMLTKGTEHYSADQLAEIVEFNALTLAGDADMDVASVSATGLADKIGMALDLMSDVVRRPTFPEQEFNLLKQQRIVSLSISEEDPGYLADRELRRQVYGNHPYARTVTGESADVKKLELPVCVEWWKTYARPDAAILYVAGDVDPQQVFDLVGKNFGDWKAEGALPEPKLPAIPPHQPTHIYLVDNPGAVQSQIRVGQTSITRGDPYYHAARVYTQIFGGSFGSRLNEVIRVQKGLTYGAGGGFMPYRFSGTYMGHTFTKTPTTAETVQALIDVVKSMQSKPPTDAELSVAKSYLVGSFPSQLETPQDRVAFQWTIDYNKLPQDYLNQALQGYRKTTSKDLEHIASAIVKPEELAVVVVGDAKAVQADLEKIAPVTVVGRAPQAEKQSAPEAPAPTKGQPEPAPAAPGQTPPEPAPAAPTTPAPAPAPEPAPAK